MAGHSLTVLSRALIPQHSESTMNTLYFTSFPKTRSLIHLYHALIIISHLRRRHHHWPQRQQRQNTRQKPPSHRQVSHQRPRLLKCRLLAQHSVRTLCIFTWKFYFSIHLRWYSVRDARNGKIWPPPSFSHDVNHVAIQCIEHVSWVPLRSMMRKA